MTPLFFASVLCAKPAGASVEELTSTPSRLIPCLAQLWNNADGASRQVRSVGVGLFAGRDGGTAGVHPRGRQRRHRRGCHRRRRLRFCQFLVTAGKGVGFLRASRRPRKGTCEACAAALCENSRALTDILCESMWWFDSSSYFLSCWGTGVLFPGAENTGA